METELGQEEQKALQGHRSKGEQNGDSKSLGTFLPFSLKHGPSISPICRGPRPLREQVEDTATAKVPHRAPLLPWLAHWSGVSQDVPQEGYPICTWHLNHQDGGEGEPPGCQQILGGSLVESEEAGGRYRHALLSAAEILPLLAGFTAVPLPLTPGYASPSHWHHLFHSKVGDYSDSIFFPWCSVYVQYTSCFTQGAAWFA